MRLLRRSFFKTIAAATSFWMAASLVAVPAHATEKVTVFAAASMKNALDAINAEWAKDSGNEATVSYAASSALAKQIEQGAPADIFISADLAWMDYVADKKLINADSRSNLLGNRIVLVAPADKAKPVEIKQGFDLAALVGDGRLAMGAVDSVPAGKYGKAALEKLGVWSSVEQKVAGAESVRAAPAARFSRRSPLWHRLPDRRRRRSRCEDHRHLPGRQPSADHLPGRHSFGSEVPGSKSLSGFP